MPSLFDPQSIGAESEGYLAEIEAINNVAQEEGRDLTEEEAKHQDSLLQRLETNSERMKRAKKHQEFVAKSKGQTDPIPLPKKAHIKRTGEAPPWDLPWQVENRNYKFQAFKGPFAKHVAYAAAMQLGAFAGIPDSIAFCNDMNLPFKDGNRDIIRNANVGDVDSAGGYTVPDPTAAALIEYRERVAVARMICDVVPMTSDTLSMPKLVSGQTVFYPGQANAITESQLVYDNVPLVSIKRATLTKLSNELIADSLIPVVDRTLSRAAYQLALREDQEWVNGDGTPAFGNVTGLNQSVGAAGIHTSSATAWSGITSDDMTTVTALLPDEHHPGACWVCSRPFFAAVMQRISLAQGGSTAMEMQAGVGFTFLGYPVYFTSACPTSADNSVRNCYLGNFMEGVLLGDRDSIQLATSAEYAFNEDVLTTRSTVRYDINVHHASTAGAARAIVALDIT